jgi:hypothetical protein
MATIAAISRVCGAPRELVIRAIIPDYTLLRMSGRAAL